MRSSTKAFSTENKKFLKLDFFFEPKFFNVFLFAETL